MKLKDFGLPSFETIAGHTLESGTMDHDDVPFCILFVTEKEVRKYAETLESEGFTKYTSNEIPAGSDSPCFTNLFYTFIKNGRHIFIFYNAPLHNARIVVMPEKTLPPTFKASSDGDDEISPTFSQMQIDGGLSMVAQLKDSSFVIIDGGLYTPEDCERLYHFIKGRTPENKKPLIAMWLFTHMHCDHIELASHFIKQYSEEIEIKSFAQQFQDCRTIELSIEKDKISIDAKAILEENIKNNFRDAPYYTLHTGQKYYFPGMELEILWSGDDMYPATLKSFNEFSIACRMTFESGKTVMILGDCMHTACRNIAETYGDYLKSDVLQLAHHGLIGGNKRLYKFIDPDICLWATSKARFEGKLPGQAYQYCLGEGELDYNAWIRDDSIKKRAHHHNDEITIINM